MQINSINSTNFGMKYSDKFNNILENYPKTEIGFSSDLKTIKEEMASMLPDTYTMDIIDINGRNNIVLRRKNKKTQLLAYFDNGVTLGSDFMNLIKYYLEGAKNFEKYYPTAKRQK